TGTRTATGSHRQGTGATGTNRSASGLGADGGIRHHRYGHHIAPLDTGTGDHPAGVATRGRQARGRIVGRTGGTSNRGPTGRGRGARSRLGTTRSIHIVPLVSLGRNPTRGGGYVGQVAGITTGTDRMVGTNGTTRQGRANRNAVVRAVGRVIR